MAEVTRVLREVQLDTEGGFSRLRSKVVKDDSDAVGATKADRNMAVARNKGVGTFVDEIGVTKAKLANKKAAGTSMVKAASWSDFAVNKADAGNKAAAGSITGEISVAKAEPGNKLAAGTFTSEIGVAKAEMGNKPTFTSEIGVTKAEKGSKEVVGTTKPLEGVEEPKEERKAEPAVTKERVPESYIARIKARPLRKIPPLSDRLYASNPGRREVVESTIRHINYLVDMEQDCLRQHKEKGYAEIGVDLTSGVKKVFILPN